MRFCLDEQKVIGYDYGVPTSYSPKHLGVDWKADYVPLYAPENGVITNVTTGTQGGKTIWFKPDGKTIVLRWLHLDKILVTKGSQVTEGQKLAITGNTGASNLSHLHEDHWPKGIVSLKFSDTQDPRKYYQLNKTFMKITVVANRISWDLNTKLSALKQKFLQDSSNRFEPVFDIKITDYTTIPLKPFADNTAIDVNWYREHITPLGTGQATLFTMNPADYNNGLTWGFMTYGDANKPVRIEVSGTENEFVDRAFHEICHALMFLTGQDDRVHELLYQNPPKPVDLMNYVDYTKLQQKLVTIKPVDKIKIRQIKWNDPERGLYIPFDTPATQAEIIAKINDILPKYELDTSKEYGLGNRPF